MRTAAVIILGCLVCALVSIVLFNPGLTFDPSAWMVWASELPRGTLGLTSIEAPSWKPLPVLFAAPFTVIQWDLGSDFWLLIVRASAFATSVLLWRAASRALSLGGRSWDTGLAPVVGGSAAALLPWLSPLWVQLAVCGLSEPVLIALLLAAIELHQSGRRLGALALLTAAALVRPEIWLVLALYSAWLVWHEGARVLGPIALAAAVQLLSWFAIPYWASGDSLQATHRARIYKDRSFPGHEFIAGVGGLVPWEAWLLVGVGLTCCLLLRRRVFALFAGPALLWLAVVALMTAVGYSGIARYALPAFVLLAVPAGVGLGCLVSAIRQPGLALLTAGAVAVLAGGALLAGAGDVNARLDRVERIGAVGSDSVTAVERAGGVKRLIRRCPLLGTSWDIAPVLAWRLHLPLEAIAFRANAPAVLLLHPKYSMMSSADVLAAWLFHKRVRLQAVPPAGTTRSTALAETRYWRVVSYDSRASSCIGGN